MKICMFTNTYLPHVGGVARSVNSFATELRSRGNKVLVIAPVFPGYEAHDLEETDIIRVPAIQEFNGSDFSMRIPVPFFIDERIDAFDPDIIHSHHPYLLGDAALRAARRRRLPLVFTHHTLYELYVHYVPGQSEKMQRFAAILSTLYANLCDHVIAPSQSLAVLIRDRGVNLPVTEIPTGIDIDFFSKGNGDGFRKTHGIEKNALVIGHLGRLAPEKNLEYLSTAVSRVIQDIPEAVFLLVGDGPSKEEINKTFKEKNLDRQLVLTGSLSGKPLADAYHAMDIFVFSSHSETQGLVLAEAMAAGIPVIALDAPGVREIVRHGVNGMLLEKDTPESMFARVLKEAILDPQKNRSRRIAAKKTALAFSRDICTDKLYRLYESIISRSRDAMAENSDNLDTWDSFLRNLEIERDLIVAKTKAIVQTVTEDDDA